MYKVDRLQPRGSALPRLVGPAAGGASDPLHPRAAGVQIPRLVVGMAASSVARAMRRMD